MELFEELAAKIKGKNLTLVFPEGEDPRIQGAAVRLADDGLVKPILLGKEAEIKAVAKENSFTLDAVEILDPAQYPAAEREEMINKLVDRRKGKTDAVTAAKWLQDVNYFGTMMVYMGLADGMVSGAKHPTGDTVRPALQIVKTKPGSSRISGSFLMQKGDERYIFADCAINTEINSELMAEIAIQSADSARAFGLEPKVAMLSFSTKGSAKSPDVEKVSEATKLVHELQPDLAVDGELQFDAAFVEAVAAAKAPGSKVAGQANVFVFPDLQAGNIGYKIAQRMGGYEAMGPILQGLAKPISDLSRGCDEEDVYKVAIITAAQV